MGDGIAGRHGDHVLPCATQESEVVSGIVIAQFRHPVVGSVLDRRLNGSHVSLHVPVIIIHYMYCKV